MKLRYSKSTSTSFSTLQIGGSVTLKMRFPSALVTTKLWDPYCIETAESMTVAHETVGDSVILLFEAHALGGLSGLYNDILQGDLRVLYLGWLRAI